MQASNVSDENYLVSEYGRLPENAAARRAPSASHDTDAMRPDSSGVLVSFGTIQEVSRPADGRNPPLTSKQSEHQIRQTYIKTEKNIQRRAGANAILAYLEVQGRSLAEVTKSDLERWSLTPFAIGKRNLPRAQAFEGAKALCALAAEVGHLDARRAQEIGECKRPRFDVDVLRSLLENPGLTSKEREDHIRGYYQSVTTDANRQIGASAFQTYLERQKISFAEVTKTDLEEWALTPNISGKRNLPSERVFDGAKGMCALAAEVGYLDPQRAQAIAECKRPHFDVDVLRILLESPVLTGKEREDLIRLNYQSAEKEHSHHVGASLLLSYLEQRGKSLALVTKSDLVLWALTPTTTGNRNLPNGSAFDGAKALCALAAEVGYIDAHRARDIAGCPRPRLDVGILRTMLQNPQLTQKEREYLIHLNYQSAETDYNRLAGSSGILAFLERQHKLLADADKSDVERWALTPIVKGRGKGNLPNGTAFEGAKGLFALAAEVGYIDTQTAKAVAECTRPQFDLHFLRTLLQSLELSPKECDYHIRVTYQSLEKEVNRQAGASGFLGYLQSQDSSLAKVTKRDLEQWMITPTATGRGHLSGNVPHPQAIDGAKALCLLAAEVGHIDGQRAQEIAECLRPHVDPDSLRIALQNPTLTRKEREYQIRLQYYRAEKNAHHRVGANGFLAYLERKGMSLAEVSKSDLEQWALTPLHRGKNDGYLPRARAFTGAQGLCALAAEVGYIDAQRAKGIAECIRPRLDLDLLRSALQNSALTSKERDCHIHLNYQSAENSNQRQTGASSLLAYLGRQAKSLAEVTKSDLEQWACTPIDVGPGKGKLPRGQSVAGAKALCALAAEVGHIDAQRAQDIAEYRPLQPGVASQSTLATTSRASYERLNKRLRRDDDGASMSISPRVALPQSDALYRELALSRPTFLHPNQQASSSHTDRTQALIDDAGHFE